MLKQHRCQSSTTDACYREVIIGSTELTVPLVLYLSPDHRFISASLVDLESAEQSDWAMRSDGARTNTLLLAEASPVRGSETAPLAVVEFGDLECPYCKRLNDWMNSLPTDLAERVRVSYKHLPLPSHPWARAAAQIAICAERQSVGAFWELHDYILQQQADVTLGNLKPKSFDLLRREHVNLQQVESCVDAGEADKIINRDLLLARHLRVDSTPTVFINGEKIAPAQSLEELQMEMRAALQSAGTMPRK